MKLLNSLLKLVSFLETVGTIPQKHIDDSFNKDLFKLPSGDQAESIMWSYLHGNHSDNGGGSDYSSGGTDYSSDSGDGGYYISDNGGYGTGDGGGGSYGSGSGERW